MRSIWYRVRFVLLELPLEPIYKSQYKRRLFISTQSILCTHHFFIDNISIDIEWKKIIIRPFIMENFKLFRYLPTFTLKGIISSTTGKPHQPPPYGQEMQTCNILFGFLVHLWRLVSYRSLQFRTGILNQSHKWSTDQCTQAAKLLGSISGRCQKKCRNRTEPDIGTESFLDIVKMSKKIPSRCQVPFGKRSCVDVGRKSWGHCNDVPEQLYPDVGKMWFFYVVSLSGPDVGPTF